MGANWTTGWTLEIESERRGESRGLHNWPPPYPVQSLSCPSILSVTSEGMHVNNQKTFDRDALAQPVLVRTNCLIIVLFSTTKLWLAHPKFALKNSTNCWTQFRSTGASTGIKREWLDNWLAKPMIGEDTRRMAAWLNKSANHSFIHSIMTMMRTRRACVCNPTGNPHLIKDATFASGARSRAQKSADQQWMNKPGILVDCPMLTWFVNGVLWTSKLRLSEPMFSDKMFRIIQTCEMILHANQIANDRRKQVQI